MFTGIIRYVGSIEAVQTSPDGTRITVSTALTGFDVGDSVAVDGVCLTVEALTEDGFEAFLASETREKTTFDSLQVGQPVNLERPLEATARLDGHFVQGHVDGTTTLLDRQQVGEDWLFEWAIPSSLDAYIASKGSIALDGVSLTVADRTPDRFRTAIIPETAQQTTLGECHPGDAVNVEVDILAKYVERQLQSS